MKHFLRGAVATSLIAGGAVGLWVLAMLFTPQASALASELFISEYIEGSNFNKAIEIYNGTGGAVSLTNYRLELYSNGGLSISQSMTLSGSLADGDVLVLAHPNSAAAIIAQADSTSSTVINFNGDDALILRRISDNAVIDSFGQLGNDPGSAWTGGGLSTANNTIRRLPSICAGDTIPDDAFDPSVEWEGFAQDTFDGLGAHTCADTTPLIVINELISNPDAVTDANGEWLELYNAGTDTVNINGWTIADNDSDSHVINNGAPLIIPAGGYLVLGNNTDSLTNGGVTVAYDYGSYTLANSADEVVLFDASLNEIDRVEYTNTFPLAVGASMALISPELDNNVSENWCEASTSYGDGDFGTPGSANDCVVPAPLVVINELIQNPDAVSDANGEWVELYNAGDNPVDINGWTIADNDSDSHVINNGAPLVIPAGGYLVLGNNTDFGTNGGVNVAYDYGGYALANGADEVVLLDASLNEIDRVEYDGGPNFPDPTGASMALIAPELDNNVGANWCESVTPFGAGDLGTPGSANDCGNQLVLLLLTEVVVTPTGGEFIEIYNNGTTPIDLSNIYVTDATFSADGTFYYNIVTGTLAGGGGFSDFHARFPDGATIAPSEYQTIALAGSEDFFAEYGVNPTYELFEDGLSADAIADMREALAGSIDNQGGLTNSGEVVILYEWDGTSDLVTDLDYFVWSDEAEAVDKTGVSIDGPDADAVASTYLPDISVGNQDEFVLAHVNGESYQRNDLTEGEEIQTGGNGSAGHNEMSENLTVTWCVASVTPNSPSSCAPVVNPVVGICTDPATFIHDIQGSGAVSPMNGATNVIIEGVVVADFQDNDLNGFHVQEEDTDADADPLTSEGIFVYEGASSVNVNVGDVVRLIGEVDEFFELTEITNLGGVIICDQPGTATASDVFLPFPASVAGVDFLERYEGMLVNFTQDLYVTEHFNLDRGGMMTLSSGGRLDQPTNVATPGVASNAIQASNDLNRIILDDGSRAQNPFPIIHPSPALSATNTLRGGDIVRDIYGVLTYSNAGWTGSGGDAAFRVHPLATPTYEHVNLRPDSAPAVGGNITVASFNVLNFFNGDGQGGGFPTSRGATTFSDYQRQRENLITAIIGLDADVIGLIEIENDGFGEFSAIQDLVNGLNDIAGAGTYAFVDPGVSQVGTDEIMVALIYNATVVQESGIASILDTPANVFQGPSTNRAILAQTFTVVDALNPSLGEAFTIAVNHFKSKGQSGLSCPTPASDPNCDQGDGQGFWNARRVEAANALVAWLGTDPTGSSDPDFLIIGDLNGYEMEDPVTTIMGAGYTNLAAGDYSYAFDGQWGSLDHALGNPTLTAQVTGAAHYHINADEPDALDYSSQFNDPSLFANDGFRASDHDPVVIGLNLAPPPSDITIIKQASPDTITIFTFNDNEFQLSDGSSVSFTNLSPGNYTFVEDFAQGWTLDNIDCGVASVTPIENGVIIALGGDESVTCTFYNVDINDPPLASNDGYTINEDTATLFSVLDNDSDPESNGLTITGVGNFNNGIPVIQGSQILFTPDANFNGYASFTYTITDGELSDTALVEITVLPVNDPPVAVDDSGETDEDTSVVIDVKANDSDIDGDFTTVIIINSGADGVATTDGLTATFTPNLDFSGVTTFTYALLDAENVQSNTATVTVTVNPDLCTSPNPAVDLTGTLISSNVGVVTNGSEACSYEVGMASYYKYDDVIEHQIIYDYTNPTIMIEPGQTLQIEIAVPECAAQVDLFWGAVLLSLDGQRYGPRLLAALHINGANYCTDTDPAPQDEQPIVDAQTTGQAFVLQSAPPLLACTVEDNRPDSVFRVRMVGAGISSAEAICRVVAQDGVMVIPGAVGDQSVVDQGVIHAVDVFGVDPSVSGAIEVCLQGAGGMIYLDASLSPREPQWMPTTQSNGYTCTTIPRAGMVVLTQNNDYVGASADLTSDAPSQMLTIGTCSVTTTNMVNIRTEPNTTSSSIITTLPFEITLDATERSSDWVRVIYLDGQGWVHTDYLTLQGSCG